MLLFTPSGMVPDGVAGIFQCSTSKEIVNMRTRKGLSKLALRTGTPLFPGYSVGNTSVFDALFDPWGVMEFLSRKLKVSLFVPYGRFGLPIPRRSNITMIFGAVIPVEKVPEPTEKQVDELHEKLCNAIQDIFNTHKVSLGWGDKELIVV